MKNRFETKKEFLKGFHQVITPLFAQGEVENGLLKLGTSGSVYCERTRQVEAFLRPLWAVGPFLTTTDDDKLKNSFLKGIISGTDPNSEHYWGEAKDFDQLLVEMAALSNTLLLAKEKTWDLMTHGEQENLYNWLNQINERDMPVNNWVFFRVLVNLAFKECGKPWDKKQMEADLQVAESFYIDNGWYFDGVDSQMDYYISFAIHYYGLIYTKYMAKEDPKRVELIKKRAISFAQTFKYWFDDTGEALPFGRSLTYRFAQCSFWSALVFADVEALPWGEIKGLISRNMASWFEKDIFSRDGLLTIGYHYENLVMAEGYNAPGSPYWALKTFLLLAVPKEHPYWQAAVEPIAYEGKQKLIPEARMLMTQHNGQVQAFVGGQLENKQAHVDAKYSKLVYSTTFGFSVSKGSFYYKQGGFDNCLAVAEDDRYYRSKLETKSYEVLEDRVINVWQPFSDVDIKTTVIPLTDWHIRIHEIETKRELFANEGGYSVPVNEGDLLTQQENGLSYQSEVGVTAIYNLLGFKDNELVVTEPNTNLFFNKSTYPKLGAQLKPGTHLLVSLVGGVTDKDYEEAPIVTIKDRKIQITQKEEVKVIEF